MRGQFGLFVGMCVVLVMGKPSLAGAQAHPEMLDVSIDKGWHQTMDFYFDYYRGNVNQTNISTNITSSLHRGRHESMLEGLFWFGFFDGEEVLNQVNFTGRHVRTLGRNLNENPWSLDFWGQYQRDNLIGLNRRFAGGAGLRREFFTRGGPDDPYDLFAGLGLFHETEEFDVLIQNNQQRIRLGSYVTQTWEPNDSWLINLGLYFNPKLTDPSDFRQLISLDFLYAVGDNIYLSSKSRTRYDHNPGTGVEKFDLFTIFGLSYSF